MNYKVTRIGLLNFWYFDDEVFEFSDGKLLLRGENGSGKSVTMQSFIPLILDGNKMPNRLDPFGSKEKRIEDYLLGPSDGFQKDDSTGYIYMEVYNESLNKYITVGMGLRAKKGQGTDFWGFAIKDGRRIGQDFILYKDFGTKVLLTKRELRSKLENTNEYTESQKEYKKIVNDLLFGFKDLDMYDEFINILLQLRSSKLSKEYTPVKLMEILSSVLQPLTHEDIMPLSEAIEQTNNTKEIKTKLESQVKSLSNLIKTYQNYNEIILYNKARSSYDKKKYVNELQNNIKSNEQKLIESVNKEKEIKEKLNSLDKELIEVETKLETIDNKDLKKYTKDLEEVKQNIIKIELSITNIKKQIEEYLTKERQYKNKRKECQDKEDIERKNLSNLCNDIIDLSDEVKLQDIHTQVVKIAQEKDSNFEYIKTRVNKYKSQLNQVKFKLEEKENKELELDNLESEHEHLKKEIEEKTKILNNNETKLKNEITNFIDNLNVIEKDNKIVKLENSIKKRIFEYMNEYSYDNYIKAKDEYINTCKYFENDIRTNKSNIDSKLFIEKEKLSKLNNELAILKSNKELEIDEDKNVIDKLNSLNIPFISLYKTIEFKDNVKAEDKNKIEELLISMNILNAKIIHKKDLDKIKDINCVFLKASKKKSKNLLDYFKVIENDLINKNEIIEILEGINIEPSSDIFITPNKYNLDFIVGYSSGIYNSKYIGLINRIKEQKRKIEEKEKEVEDEETIIRNYQNIILEFDKKLELIKIESNLFPDNKILETIKNEIKKLENYIEADNNQDTVITNKILEVSKVIELIISDINNIKGNITIPLNLASYKQALEELDSLKDYLIKLELSFNSLTRYKEQKISFENMLSDIIYDIESKTEELDSKNKELNTLNSKKKAIDEILSNQDYQDLIKELESLNERKKEIPTLKDSLNTEKGGINTTIFNIKSSIEKDQNLLGTNLLELELINTIFEKEYKLNYVYKDENIDINKILTDLKSRKDSDIYKAISNYSDAYNTYRLELTDYNLSSAEIFSNNDEIINIYIEKGLDVEIVKSILQTSSRQDMTAIYQGKRVNIYELLDNLNESIKENESYISRQERHLFEDILLQTVGGKIRDRIETSKNWVSKINEIMKLAGSESNLSFELEWRSKTAYTEDELDTKELVRIFKIDAGQVNDDDRQKLMHHFQNKIKKELEYNDKKHESYSDVISRVLDYRTWFEFKLYYRRKSGEKRELTNKIFFVFSGGERAKCMYMPLFAATYAKLLSADKSALRLIALDEAFAGVDNANIREMFDVLSKLNLDYILTSQSLWGDYDSVKSMLICELIKDEQHKAVAVRHYLWNGKKIEYLESDNI